MNPRDYTAWLDGAASPRQARRVERELGAAAREEKESWEKIRVLLREHLKPCRLEHPDLINARVAEVLAKPSAKRIQLAPLHPWAWAGGGALAVAALLAAVLLPSFPPPAEERPLSRVLSARAADARMYVTAFRAPAGRGVVVWIEGAGYIGPEEKVR